MATQAQRAEAFRRLHHVDTPLLLANVWDPLSAAIVANAGLPAVATASAAVALSRGFDDGEQVPFGELVRLVGRISDVVDVPISVDFERGYGDTPGEVRDNTIRLIDAGAVGVNIEDSLHDHQLRVLEDQCERINAVRQAGHDRGVPIFINARTDVFMLNGDEDEGLRRLQAYGGAGADGVYPIMCTDLATLERIHNATGLPINVLLTPSIPPLSDLMRVGATRISLGPGLLSIAAAATADVVRRLSGGDLRLEDIPRMPTSVMRRIQDIG